MTKDEESVSLSPSITALTSAVRDLHTRRGSPSSRTLASTIGGISHSTVNAVLNGTRLPTWPVLSKVISALDGEEEQFRGLWVTARESSQLDEAVGRPTGSQVSVFASYARIDDKATYGRISKIVDDVRATYRSFTGKEMGLFKDTETISAGEDWKDRIRLGLADSSIFLAFVSPAYLRSVACREELREFFSFLETSSSTKLIVPLLFADPDRVERHFAGDEMWRELLKLHRIDISELRAIDPGSEKWIVRVNEIADRVDDVLTEMEDSPPTPLRAEVQKTIEEAIISGHLEKLAEFERVTPDTLQNLATIGKIFEQLGEEAVAATPEIQHADTFGKKLAVSTRFADKLSPLADELDTAANDLTDEISKWDAGVRSIIELARTSSMQDADGYDSFIEAIKEMIDKAIPSLSQVEGLYDSLASVMGLSAYLDKPLKRMQRSILKVAELRAVFKGWKEEIDILESMQ
ncbi:toll/interleukin-1 receptor domain-containing protein [Streptomyces sp. ID05-26A]|nr:toll/interleukin-1 receptor domain-containing protein [Streptomyces sp. ID05-26A]